jgi:hypothetical protein
MSLLSTLYFMFELNKKTVFFSLIHQYLDVDKWPAWFKPNIPIEEKQIKGLHKNLKCKLRKIYINVWELIEDLYLLSLKQIN